MPDCLALGILFADVGCWPIDRLPDAGELVPTERVQLSLGGCASNVALDLAKLEFHVGLAGCVGDDAFSDYIVKSLSVPNVDTSHLKRVPNMGPGSTLIVNVQGEDRRFISTTGANAEFDVEDIPEEWLKTAKALYLGGFLMMPKLESSKTVDMFRLAQSYGCRTILDVVLYGDRPYWDAVAPLLPYTDVFVPNDWEAKMLSGLDNPIEQAEFFLKAGVKAAVITCGEQGTYYLSASERFKSGIYPTKFVGGTGSGNAFAAGFMAGICQKLSPQDCVRWGSALGASCVRDVSATESVFNRQEMEAFLAANSLKMEILST
ncbi:MAG: carbohydrate kinase family protein [Planctomycetaceae bacterium]|jgi:sugar/nucleoside kinase (ribokinase family)|nr:carbohydrate kinase family protein [Planctomycetaceae bacterium]